MTSMDGGNTGIVGNDPGAAADLRETTHGRKMNATRKLTVALLAAPDATASMLYGMYDMFCSVGRDWDFVTRGAPGAALITTRVVSHREDLFRAANAVPIQPDASVADEPCPDIVCVPDLLLPPGAPLSGDYDCILNWLNRCYAAGSVLATVCSGATLLAHAGLLTGRQATTHWAYCDRLQHDFPEVTVLPNRIVVTDGEGHRLVTAGGGASWVDLVLYLVARFFTLEEAIRLAKLYLVDWHSSGQLPYAVLNRTRQTHDRTIADCQEWLAHNYHGANPVAAMAQRSGLNERSFARRFRKATGMAPMEYVHALRLEEAKQILETSDRTIDDVSMDVGYNDSGFFRRLFKRQVGLSPSRYRRKFQLLRQGLDGIASGQPATPGRPPRPSPAPR